MNDKQRNALQGQIVEAVEQRSPWELRQTRWYELRHHGLRRTNKPWPKAADLHWPLIDTAIEKLKPLFLQQALGMDVVASFVPNPVMVRFALDDFLRGNALERAQVYEILNRIGEQPRITLTPLPIGLSPIDQQSLDYASGSHASGQRYRLGIRRG